MNKTVFEVVSNAPVNPGIYKMKLRGDTSAIERPGQFVNIRLDGLYLRRPISVCDVEGNILTLVYRVVGEGTRRMSALRRGAKLDALCGLGNGFDTSKSGEKPLLIGGGLGAPPLYLLAKTLVKLGREVTVILGFNSLTGCCCLDEFHDLNVKTFLTTVDGSVGLKGVVTDKMRELDYSYFYACGPEPMLRAVCETAASEGEMSFEERMGCGFGACMGCSCQTLTGYKRICRDGPVLERREIIWPERM